MEAVRAGRRDARRARLRLLPAQQARGVGGVPRPGHPVRAGPLPAAALSALRGRGSACRRPRLAGSRHEPPEASVETRLARWGFADVAGSRPLIALPPLDGVLDVRPAARGARRLPPTPTSRSAASQRLAEALGPGRVGRAGRVAGRPTSALRVRLSGVLGASTALAEHLARHPDQWPDLAGDRGGQRLAPLRRPGRPARRGGRRPRGRRAGRGLRRPRGVRPAAGRLPAGPARHRGRAT